MPDLLFSNRSIAQSFHKLLGQGDAIQAQLGPWFSPRPRITIIRTPLKYTAIKSMAAQRRLCAELHRAPTASSGWLQARRLRIVTRWLGTLFDPGRCRAGTLQENEKYSSSLFHIHVVFLSPFLLSPPFPRTFQVLHEANATGGKTHRELKTGGRSPPPPDVAGSRHQMDIVRNTTLP